MCYVDCTMVFRLIPFAPWPKTRESDDLISLKWEVQLYLPLVVFFLVCLKYYWKGPLKSRLRRKTFQRICFFSELTAKMRPHLKRVDDAILRPYNDTSVISGCCKRANEKLFALEQRGFPPTDRAWRKLNYLRFRYPHFPGFIKALSNYLTSASW